MSSNPNKEERRIRSIKGKVMRMLIARRLGGVFGGSLGLFVLIPILWAVYTVTEKLGTFSFSYKVLLTMPDGVKSLMFKLTDAAGTVLMTESAYKIVLFSAVASTVVFAFRFIGALLSIGPDLTKISTILAPIDELATRADEISNFEFDESKYQLLENAISKIEPDDNKEILLPDKELQGIETAMNKLIGRMKENYRQQARFVNDASHELRTPIAVIEGYANMLSRWGRDDEKVLEESITAIKNESANMKHLVEQLLFLARGDSGRTELKPEDVDLNAMMQEIYEESLMIDEHHRYRIKLFNGNLHINADPGLLKQAVRILVDNAAKYTNEGDEIILGTGINEKGEDYLMVQDTGIGMSANDVEHMFERFYRADEARSREGTGLGLSIAKWIVDRHKGNFTVVSRTDLGTRICINL